MGSGTCSTRSGANFYLFPTATSTPHELHLVKLVNLRFFRFCWEFSRSRGNPRRKQSSLGYTHGVVPGLLGTKGSQDPVAYRLERLPQLRLLEGLACYATSRIVASPLAPNQIMNGSPPVVAIDAGRHGFGRDNSTTSSSRTAPLLQSEIGSHTSSAHSMTSSVGPPS